MRLLHLCYKYRQRVLAKPRVLQEQKLPVPVNNETYLDRLNRYLTLSLSISERAARALSAIVGSSTLLLTKTLIPTAIQKSNSYKFT